MILRDGQSPAGALRRRPFAGLFELLRDGNYGRFAFSNLLYNFGQGNIFGFLTLFVRDALQGSQEFASLCLGVAQATSAGARFGWGVVSDLMFGAAAANGLSSASGLRRSCCWHVWELRRPAGRRRL